MRVHLCFLMAFLLALLLSVSRAPAKEASTPGREDVSPYCTAAIDRAAGHRSQCLLKANAKYAKNSAHLFAQQAKCEENFKTQTARVQAGFGEGQCTPHMIEIEEQTEDYAMLLASEAPGLGSPSLPSMQNGMQHLSIATGSAGWEYNKTGLEVCTKLNEIDRFRCKAIVTLGSLQNIKLLQDKKVNLALSQSDMIPEDSANFVSLKTLSRQALYIFVRKNSNIDSVHDLMHKRVNAGPIGSGLRGTMDNVMEATDIVPSEVSGTTAAKEAKMLCRNQTDAIAFILDLDAPQVEQIEKTCLMRRLAFSRNTLKEIMRINATYYPINLGSSNREDAYAVGLYVDLITYKDALPLEDHQ